MEPPQNRTIYFEEWSSFPLAQLYRWNEDNICQSIWDKSEVLWRTCWGTYLEPWQNEKKSFPFPQLKTKKSKAPWVPSHWMHEISLLKRVCHHFWPGLIPFTKNTLPIWLAHCKKKLKLWRLPKIEDSMEKWSASPFGTPI